MTKHLAFIDGIPSFHRDDEVHIAVNEMIGIWTALGMVSVNPDRFIQSIIPACRCGKTGCSDRDYLALVVVPLASADGTKPKDGDVIHVVRLATLSYSKLGEFEEAFTEGMAWVIEHTSGGDHATRQIRWALHAVSRVGKDPMQFIRFLSEAKLVDMSKLHVAEVGTDGYKRIASAADFVLRKDEMIQ